MNQPPITHRILIVDDNQAVRDDFAKVLIATTPANDLAADSAALFGDAPPPTAAPTASFRVDFASQGEQALSMVRAAQAEGQPYAMAFVDMRMPPGWDGLRTTEELWRAAPDLQVVICTAYSDHSLATISTRLGHPDRLLVLKKPFDAIEVAQLAASLSEKWRLTIEAREHLQQLNEALVQAEAATKAKSQFLANMSHEIRTPMTAILGSTEVLIDEALPRDEQVTYLRTIQGSGRHMLQLLGDILDFSKVESGQMALESRPFVVSRVVEEATAMLRPTAAGKGLTLRLLQQGEFPDTVCGDEMRIRQVVLNLLGNAIKFTAHGHVEVRSRVDRTSRSHCVLHVEVEDTGIGINPEQLALLFAPFTQGDASVSRRFGGTGLGLAISRRLANAMGGDVAVASPSSKDSSSATKGSCFTATFQLAMPATASWSQVSPPSARGSGNAAVPPAEQQLTARVLLVDDEPNNRLLFSRMLQNVGAEVRVADTAHLALSEWQDSSRGGRAFDLVLCDLHMPEVDGFEVARRLREAGCRAPLIALTASAIGEDRDRCLREGFADFLTKPVERRKLVQSCLDAIAGAEPPRPR